MNIENRSFTECQDGTRVVWNVEDGKEIVFLEFQDDRGQIVIDVLLETEDYRKAEIAYNNAKEYMA